MPFDWHEYLVWAENISATGTDDEAALRAAVSRAYYAVYNQAAKFLIDQNIIPNRPEQGSHERVWQAFEDKGGVTCRTISDRGDKLKWKRVLADYRTQELKWKEEVKLSINYAQLIEFNLNKLKTAIEKSKDS